MLGIEVRAVAHFEAILNQWCHHCFEQLSPTEAGMVAIHLQQVATLSTHLAREAEHVCKGRFMFPCPMFETGMTESPEKLCNILRKELHSFALRGYRKGASDPHVPEGCQIFQMLDDGDEELGTQHSSSEECSRLQETLEASERHVEELCKAERLLRKELDSKSSRHAALAELTDEKFELQDRVRELELLLEQQSEAIVQAPEEPDALPEAVLAEPPKDCSIAAVVRLKPHPPTGVPILTLQDGVSGTVVDTRTGQDYQFDHVFGPESTTEELFESCAGELVRSFCQGENATIMAYGQTASGKTFTMEGGGSQDGIVQLSVEAICAYFADPLRDGTSYGMQVAYLEIHNEKVLDLLSSGGPAEVRLLESATGAVQTAPALTHFNVIKPIDLIHCIEAGRANRHVGQTRANDYSSRSHTVLQLQLESQKPNEVFMRRSLLNLVDLAGSESAKHTDAAGERLIEGRNINRSLLALSQVVQAMSDTSAPRPSFRDSKLTRVLQQSIGGNSRTALICTVATVDWHYHENRRTLEFALRAKCIKNQVSANIVKIANRSRTGRSCHEKRLQTQNEQLQMQVAQLRSQLLTGGQENIPPKLEMRPPSPRQKQPLAQNSQENISSKVELRPPSPLQKRPLAQDGQENIPPKVEMRPLPPVQKHTLAQNGQENVIKVEIRQPSPVQKRPLAQNGQETSRKLEVRPPSPSQMRPTSRSQKKQELEAWQAQRHQSSLTDISNQQDVIRNVEKRGPRVKEHSVRLR